MRSTLPNVDEQLLVRLMDPETPFAERKAAVLDLAAAAWTQGWEDAAEALEEAFRVLEVEYFRRTGGKLIPLLSHQEVADLIKRIRERV